MKYLFRELLKVIYSDLKSVDKFRQKKSAETAPLLKVDYGLSLILTRYVALNNPNTLIITNLNEVSSFLLNCIDFINYSIGGRHEQEL